MPARNRIKPYVADSYYHIYNRGVNKRTIFKDEQDYQVFLSYLKTYLLPKETERLTGIMADPQATMREREKASQILCLCNYSGRISLLAYSLMPNHFHFLIHQVDERAVKSFMQSLLTRYTVYFNRRHKRVGVLFQGTYKGVLIDTDEQLLYLTRYIHRQSSQSSHKRSDLPRSDLFRQPSSYANYLGELKQGWVKPDFIMQFFSSAGFVSGTTGHNSYRDFVESDDTDLEAETARLAGPLSLAEEAV